MFSSSGGERAGFGPEKNLPGTLITIIPSSKPQYGKYA
jgi:hypothetical protein